MGPKKNEEQIDLFIFRRTSTKKVLEMQFRQNTRQFKARIVIAFKYAIHLLINLLQSKLSTISLTHTPQIFMNSWSLGSITFFFFDLVPRSPASSLSSGISFMPALILLGLPLALTSEPVLSLIDLLYDFPFSFGFLVSSFMLDLEAVSAFFSGDFSPRAEEVRFFGTLLELAGFPVFEAQRLLALSDTSSLLLFLTSFFIATCSVFG